MLYYYAEQGYTSVALASCLDDARYQFAPRVAQAGIVFYYPRGALGSVSLTRLAREGLRVVDPCGEFARVCSYDRLMQTH